MDRKDTLWNYVRAVPCGRVVGYGDLGRAMTNPVSGYVVGRWMASAPDGVPWWRVVAKDGRLAIAKRDPAMAQVQRARLEAEGVRFADDRVAPEAFVEVEELFEKDAGPVNESFTKGRLA